MNKRRRKKLANKEYKKLERRILKMEYNQKFDPFIEGYKFPIIKVPTILKGVNVKWIKDRKRN